MQTVYSPRHAGHAGNVELMLGRDRPRLRAAAPRRDHPGADRGGRARPGRCRPSRTTSRPRGACTRRTTSTSCRAPGRCGRRRGAAARRCPSSGRCRGCAPTCRRTDIDGLLGFYTHGRRRHLRRGHLGGGQGEPRRGADRGGAGARAARAPPSRSAGRPGTTPAPRFAGGYCFVNNAAVAAEWLRDDGAARVSDPRHRLPPRQRHAGDLLRPRRRAGRQHPRRSAWSSIRTSSATPTSAARARARASTSTCRCRTAPTSPPGRRRWTIGCAAVAAFAPDRARRLARGRHLRRRPDQPVPPRHAGLSGDRRADPRARPADALRDGGRLRGRGDRGERGGGAGGVRGGMRPRAGDLRWQIKG